jgi:TolA-binding protein
MRVLLIASSLAFVPLQSSGQENIKTLREVLVQGQAALAAGDYASAFKAFEEIQSTFSQEPEVKEKIFRLTIDPLHAYAALQFGETETAIRLFEAFVQDFSDDRSRLSFVLFNLARAYSEMDQKNEAIETYRRFVAIDPNTSEAALATLEAVRLMFESERDDEAFQALDTLYANQEDGLLRMKARLMALQKALELKRIEQARQYMLETDWSIDEMPELTVLTFAALQMGHELLATKKYADAIQCYRLVPPYDQLIIAQANRLEETRARFEARRQSVGLYQGGQFWTQFYTRLIARMEAQLKGLKEAEDYSAGLYLSYGQAYLLSGRPREAWMLFEHLARDPALSSQQQSEAHYRWILAAIQVGVWEDTYKIAKGFGRRFPDSPLVPDALYLLGSAHQEAREYRDAIKVYTEFLNRHVDHTLAPRTRFLRGFNYNLMNQAIDARADFEAFIERYPSHMLYPEARLWRALSFFSERDYTQTLEALDSLASEVKGQRLEPEVAYRQAATLYAMRDYEGALVSINQYLEKYTRHSRADEARVLLGDIQMGRGELSKARAIFMAIDPGAGHLYTYSIFQAGKILRAVAGDAEDPKQRERFLDAHLEHFQNYLLRDDVRTKERLSEALFWVGWTHLERGKEDSAREVFAQALELYGDDIDSEEVPNIIDAYARIEKRLLEVGRSEREARLKAWIELEKNKATEADRLTYFARLNLYLQAMVPADDPTNLIFEIVENVPVERIDAEGLGQIAASLVDKYPRVAEDYLIALEDEYPDSRHYSYALYTRAQLLMQEGDFEEARWHLAQFRAESPMHPLTIGATLDYAETLTKTGDYEQARTVLEDLLRLRQAKGRPHAKALLALSQNEAAAGNLKRAVPYAQRVYNVYRAYHDLAAEGYLMSALQLEALNETVMAYKTLDEMLANPLMAKLALANEAKEKHLALLESLPEGALDETAAEIAKLTEEVSE